MKWNERSIDIIRASRKDVSAKKPAKPAKAADPEKEAGTPKSAPESDKK